MSTHGLEDFLHSTANRLAEDYARIRKRNDDPGTSGDEGEANWARLVLQKWLPAGYHVVTKGRILSSGRVRDGQQIPPEISPQIDVLVLSPFYPRALVEDEVKVYLADAVVAAFECKNTLKTRHLIEAAATAAVVRRLTAPRSGTPYLELFGAPIYGVLAHSHTWQGEGSDPVGNIEKALVKGMNAVAYPRELLDVVCVADLATWWAFKIGGSGRPARRWSRGRSSGTRSCPGTPPRAACKLS
ncbi:hypothetical protein E1265_25840 [Streptomyces sp. 8K308]|uniref:DUF6602 domain-containing protein n=1 Tax=Streptomyces sp. 8K308 TaxID=2530388 RepID=UPI00105156A0|nr:DUF6602 domain-containing protein [Streptomyces sp. 8K308]TDC17909.1 hypothetical protein E1265_25840 [Streptomyces sp. 8K308]